jgi:hypothetical protein
LLLFLIFRYDHLGGFFFWGGGGSTLISEYMYIVVHIVY